MPPRGVATFMGLVMSLTLWFKLKRSAAFRARRGRALQPVAFSLVREKATSMARINSQVKRTTQARRAWEEVVGRGTPKNMVEVAAEPRVEEAAALVNEARAGQAEKGLPPPPPP